MKTSANYWFMTISCLFIAGIAQAQNDAAKEITVDQLLAAGRYSEIPLPKENDPHSHAVWAFSQYHLAPNKEVAKSAKLAHDKKDPLGTFVLMQCHQSGAGILRDQKEWSRLNFQLRSQLEKIEKPSALELFMLSHCRPGDETGAVLNPDVEKLFEEVNRHNALSFERLQKSADLGFAQACQLLALGQQDPTAARKWQQTAADLGLAEGMRYLGIQLVFGSNDAADIAKGVALTEKAAQGRDVFAMINLVVLYDQGEGVKKDPAESQNWLNKAADSGHWYGSVEKGVALLSGNYGTKVDRKEGLQTLQKAIETGNADAFNFIGTAYAKGVGFEPNGKKAVEFGEAAYRQGSGNAASLLAFIYSTGVGDVAADQGLASFWGQEALQLGFGVQQIPEPAQTAFLKRIGDIDPFALKVE